VILRRDGSRGRRREGVLLSVGVSLMACDLPRTPTWIRVNASSLRSARTAHLGGSPGPVGLFQPLLTARKAPEECQRLTAATNNRYQLTELDVRKKFWIASSSRLHYATIARDCSTTYRQEMDTERRAPVATLAGQTAR
jgi:hypothetical protein